jgi:GT2 family glycosyltransferase
MTVPEGVRAEILIIDNDPAGSARAVAAGLAQAAHAPFTIRYIHETRTGLSYARNRGIEESRGEIIAFLDDDVFVAPGWLTAFLECFQRTGAFAAGGRTMIHWETEPDAAVRACENQQDRGDFDYKMRGRMVPGGGNAAFRRCVFAHGLRFSTELGRVGTNLLSGEDTELFMRMKAAGQSLWYCAGSVMYHRVGGERVTRAYFTRQRYWHGISYAILDLRLRGKWYQTTQAAARLAKAWLVEVPRWLIGAVRRDELQKLHARCSLAKQVGYLRATFAQTPALPPQLPARRAPLAPAARGGRP